MSEAVVGIGNVAVPPPRTGFLGCDGRQKGAVDRAHDTPPSIPMMLWTYAVVSPYGGTPPYRATAPGPAL